LTVWGSSFFFLFLRLLSGQTATCEASSRTRSALRGSRGGALQFAQLEYSRSEMATIRDSFKIGYRLYAKPFVDPVFGPKIPLMLIVGDLEWLQSVRSPLVPSTVGAATDTEEVGQNRAAIPFRPCRDSLSPVSFAH